jgi:hypothetical protein
MIRKALFAAPPRNSCSNRSSEPFSNAFIAVHLRNPASGVPDEVSPDFHSSAPFTEVRLSTNTIESPFGLERGLRSCVDWSK